MSGTVPSPTRRVRRYADAGPADRSREHWQAGSTLAGIGKWSSGPPVRQHIGDVVPGAPSDRPDEKFTLNPTRSYRCEEPLLVVREVNDWRRLTREELQMWRDRLAAIRADAQGEIIN